MQVKKRRIFRKHLSALSIRRRIWLKSEIYRRFTKTQCHFCLGSKRKYYLFSVWGVNLLLVAQEKTLILYPFTSGNSEVGANFISLYPFRKQPNENTRTDCFKIVFLLNNQIMCSRFLCKQMSVPSRNYPSRSYQLIVAPRKFDVLKTRICPRSEASRANMLVLRT